ncbi:MAG: glutamyl-tRNA reductase [bacterium]
MNLILIGISHKTAPLKIRERFAFSRKRLGEALSKLLEMESIDEAVILSTCNRVEIYTCINDMEMGQVELRNFLVNYHHLEENRNSKYLYLLKDKEAIKHLFRVASGLDSQVIGENQILGQVKSAYLQAKEMGTTNGLFNRLFQKASAVGKLVRTKTRISQGNLSIGKVALKMLEEFWQRLTGKKILIIGTGKIGELVTKYLKDREVSGVFIANRTYENACLLASKVGGKAVRFDRLKEELKEADIVISATASPHLIIKREIISEIMELRRKTLVIMDLALPRDVDPEVKNVSNVILYNLDDLNSIIESNHKQRKEEAKRAEKIVEEETEKFVDNFGRSSMPHINSIIRIGTRPSPLALKQVGEIIALLKRINPHQKFEIIEIETTGDGDKETPLEKLEGTDFFTREIEQALINREIDLAVHSAKDLPESIPNGLTIAAISESVDSYDVLVSKRNLKLDELPYRARIGTSSLRRKTQLQAYRNDFKIVDIRGNIEERLRKLDNSDLDAIVIAAIGLVRLGLEKRIVQRIPFDILQPHPLQGSLALEIREKDERTKEIVKKIYSRKKIISSVQKTFAGVRWLKQ